MSEIRVRLPDGNTLTLPQGSSLLDVANTIGPGLGKAALAGRIDGQLVDLRLPLTDDAAVEIVTSKDADGGDVIRHSAEHVMADAVKRLFPNCQIDAGRADHSEKFQYDFLVDEPFTPEDLERIEKEMQSIIAEDARFEREAVSREEAKGRFSQMGEELKLSRIDDIPDDSEITVFKHGDFQDLCRGPHVQNARQIGAIKLLEASGTYFRGDESSHKLQRIYGTAFASKKELKAHLARIEEAKKRDHRRVGTALGLYEMDAIAPGSAWDFTKPKALGKDIDKGNVDPKGGYDNAWIFDDWKPGMAARHVLTARSALTGMTSFSRCAAFSRGTRTPSIAVEKKRQE